MHAQKESIFSDFHAYGQFNDMKRIDTKGTNEIRIHVQLRLSMHTTKLMARLEKKIAKKHAL